MALILKVIPDYDFAFNAAILHICSQYSALLSDLIQSDMEVFPFSDNQKFSAAIQKLKIKLSGFQSRLFFYQFCRKILNLSKKPSLGNVSSKKFPAITNQIQEILMRYQAERPEKGTPGWELETVATLKNLARLTKNFEMPKPYTFDDKDE